MKLAVLGAGAIGCFFGGLLARNNYDVTFVAKGQTYERLRTDKLIVKSVRGDFSLHVPVLNAEDLADAPVFDCILLAIKSTALEEVVPQLKKLSTAQTKIICLLNGIGNEEYLSEIFTSEQIIGGSAFISVIREAPGIVNHVGEGRLVLGPWQADASTDVLQPIVAVLQQSGIDAEITSNIRQIKWEKLLWNITYNPLTALTGTLVGKALSDPDLKKVLESIKTEYLQIAEAAGVSIGKAYTEALLLPDKEVQNHKTSMLQDLENGRQMELDAILGFAIRTAHQHHVDARTIELLYHLLRHREREAAQN
ncbi:MAG: 2-dehydropantoate 2-reductase [Sporolactobacillus sp.]